MLDIYYIVMNILETLLSAFLNKEDMQSLAPLIKLLSDNSFDVKKVLQNLNLSAILPILLKLFNSKHQGATVDYAVKGAGLNPITNIADKEIVYALGRYFHQPLG